MWPPFRVMAVENINPKLLAANKLRRIIDQGSEQRDRLVSAVSALHIQDKLVAPSALNFCAKAGRATVAIRDLTYNVHRHALGQMCDLVKFPQRYSTSLLSAGEEWKGELWGHNLNELYGHTDWQARKYLFRTVNGEVRGFLSRRFNRHIASQPLLMGFLAVCDEVGAMPVEATVGAVSFSLTCYLDDIHYITPDEPVAIGVTWSNSDFGAGRLTVALSVMRVRSGSTMTLRDVLSKVHLGSVIQESDLEISEDTAGKEVDALVGVSHDAVRQWLNPQSVERVVRALEAVQDETLSWVTLRRELAKVLVVRELDDIKGLLNEDVDDLPPPGRTADGAPIPSRWWASSAVSRMALTQLDESRRLELQQLAGSLLGDLVTKVEKNAQRE